MTKYAEVTYPNVGGDSEFAIPFEYLEQSHITVTLNAVAQVNGTDYTINETTQKVIFSGGTTAGYAVVISRETPVATDDLAVTFSDGSGLNASDLNDSTKQNIFAIQEMKDEIDESIAIVDTAMLGENNLSDVDSASTSRTNLDVYSKSETDSLFADATGALMISNNLSDVASAATSRTNLDVYSKSEVDSAIGATGTIATQDADDVSITGGSITGITDLAIADGGTGAGTATDAFDNLAPTTTKGDIIVSNGSDNIRLPIGTDDQVLTADSSESSGVKWATASSGGSLLQVDVYTSNDTWTKPSGCNSIIVELVGGGGSGATGISAGGSVGGGAGGYSKKIISSGIGSTETVTVGSGGASVTSNSNGNAGGSSSFGSHCSATGGSGGTYNSSGLSLPGASGGSGSGGTINIDGGDSDPVSASSDIGSSGGASFFGGGGAGGYDAGGGAGQAGQAYGSGGGGGGNEPSGAGTASGAGKAGIVIVYSYS